jgi:hypothetical protein
MTCTCVKTQYMSVLITVLLNEQSNNFRMSCSDQNIPSQLTVANNCFRCSAKRLSTRLIMPTYIQKSRCYLSPAFIRRYINSDILNSESNRLSMTRRSLNMLHVTFNGTVVEIHVRRVRPKELISHFSLPFIRRIFKDTVSWVTLAFELRKQLFMESLE